MAHHSSRSPFSSASNVLRKCCGFAQPAARGFRQPARLLSWSAARSSDSDPFDVLVEQQERLAEQQKQLPQQQQGPRPRWSYTPERMKGPGFSINIVRDPRRTIWQNNNDPSKLDDMYNRLLGANGDRMLPDDIKWLAVTHKSFDQGRRGFNTRLAYFGRLIVTLETTRHILATPAPADATPVPDPFGRQPLQHPALATVDKLNARLPRDVVSNEKLAKLAVDVGLPEVVRWKPRMPEKLEVSGMTVVLNTAMFAIVGAISLQHGAEVAQRVVRDKIIRRLHV